MDVGRNGSNYWYIYGISFICGSGANGPTMQIGSTSCQKFESCNFTLGGTNGQGCRIGTAQSTLVLLNCTFAVGNVNSSFFLDGSPIVIDCGGNAALVGATIPTCFFQGGSLADPHGSILRNIDFSNLGSSGSIYDLRGASGPPHRLINCKLNSTPWTTLGGSSATNKPSFYVLGSGTAGNCSRNEIQCYVCNLLTETTIIRTAGASDGVTPYSWKLVPQNSANNREFPLETFEGELWNDSIGSSKTLTVHTLTDNNTLQDNQIWLEVDYLGSSGAPLASRVTTETVRLGTAANLASDSGEAWAGTGGFTSPVKQKLTATFTPQMKGPIRWRIKYAHASVTAYVCPKADLT
jgi:hypothetical protein